jgi:hypothetical protein
MSHYMDYWLYLYVCSSFIFTKKQIIPYVHYFKIKKKVEGCCLYKVLDSGPVKHTHLSIKVRHMKMHTICI